MKLFGVAKVFVSVVFLFGAKQNRYRKGGIVDRNFTKNIKRPFGWEPNEIIFNPNLSLKAKGLWLYMNSKPDGWHFAAERIAAECADGATSVRAGLKELADAGLLKWKKQGDGRIIYTLEMDAILPVENPDSENLNLGPDPDSENPKLGKPQIGKTLTINNKEENKERIIIKKEGQVVENSLDEEQKPNNTSAGLAGNGPASRLNIRRDDFDDDKLYEKAFYERNTVHLGAN